MTAETSFDNDSQAAATDAAAVRKRPARGERRNQILQMLATMLAEPGASRITTAALARRLDVSEAALYRHFASKAQMFDALVDWIDNAVMDLATRIREGEADPHQQVRLLVQVLLQFGEKNPGIACVMVGDALVLEEMRVKNRMNQFFGHVEVRLRQSLYDACRHTATPNVEAKLRAAMLMAYVRGRLQQYVRSSFQDSPLTQLDQHLDIMLA